MRELVFLAAFVTATFAFWFYGTTSFVSKVLLPGFGHSTYVGFATFEAVALLALVASGLLIRWRRGVPRTSRRWVTLPSDRSLIRDAAAIAVVAFGAISLLLVVPLPGTSQYTTGWAILWFAPVIGLGLLCAGSRRTPTPARLGPFSLTWLGALGLSAAVTLTIGTAFPQYGTATGFAAALSPSRHVEYLFLPIGLLVAVGTGRLIARAGDRAGRRAIVAGGIAVLLLVAGNAAIAYPPQADFGGFEEGVTHGDAALWMWIGIAIPTHWTVATDHRLSSMIFGFDGNRATWVTTPALFTQSDPQAATAELHHVGVPDPATAQPIDLVVVDSVMYSGVALSPSSQAAPLSAAAIAWFQALPFLPLYENGADVVYLVLVEYSVS
jgi:hypothetical protein